VSTDRGVTSNSDKTIGAMLRELRQDAGMTLDQVAGAIGMTRSTLSKYETGKILPSVEVVERLADVLQVGSDLQRVLIDQATAMRTEVHSWRALHLPSFRRRQEEIRAIEAAATDVRVFQPSIVPGLLQTPEYCRALLQLDRVRPVDDLADAVSSRMERQAALYDETKRFDFVITEGALRWRIGSPSVHAVQLHHIAGLATLLNVEVGIVPSLAEVGARQTNMFAIFDASAVVVETMTAELTLREEQLIGFYARVFDTLRASAVYGDDARTVLDGIAAELRAIS
jgi:transcriptional regulator with XRE-family HTH domain